jgi:hypothetical protein
MEEDRRVRPFLGPTPVLNGSLVSTGMDKFCRGGTCVSAFFFGLTPAPSGSLVTGGMDNFCRGGPACPPMRAHTQVRPYSSFRLFLPATVLLVPKLQLGDADYFAKLRLATARLLWNSWLLSKAELCTQMGSQAGACELEKIGGANRMLQNVIMGGFMKG